MTSSLIERIRGVLTVDFCPQFNRYVYWMKHPVACLILAAVASLVFAIFLKPIAWAVFGGILFVLVMGLVWPWLAIRGISAEIRFSEEPVTEGQPTRLTVNLRNRWPWPAWGFSLEQLLPTGWTHSRSGLHFGENPSPISLARVPGRSQNAFHWTIVPSCRGVFPRTTPSLATAFPFGLWTCRRPLKVLSSLTVWPKTIEVEQLLDASQTSPSDDQFSDFLTGEFGDMTGTRSFRQGDSLRRVHWAQTARYDELIVCERQASVVSRVELVANLSPEIHSPGPNGTLEWTLRILASLAKAWHAEQAQVTCHWGTTPFAVSSGVRGLHRLLTELANVPHDGVAFEPPPSTPAGLRVLLSTDRDVTRQSLATSNFCQIVLRKTGFEDGHRETTSVEALPEKSLVYLPDAQSIAENFRNEWRGVCHVG